MYYATEPDNNWLENDGGVRVGGFRGHFYDPSTGSNYLGGRDPTANTRLSLHYAKVVKAYKAGAKGEGWVELGRAIHYLGDLNAPHHAANMPNFDTKVYWTPAHTWFESWVDQHTNGFAIGTAPAATYEYATANNAWRIGHDMAIGAKPVASYVDTLQEAQKVFNSTMAARPTLQRAQRITAGILHKFLVDVNYGF